MLRIWGGKREREREREGQRMCACERECEREREKDCGDYNSVLTAYSWPNGQLNFLENYCFFFGFQFSRINRECNVAIKKNFSVIGSIT